MPARQGSSRGRDLSMSSMRLIGDSDDIEKEEEEESRIEERSYVHEPRGFPKIGVEHQAGPERLATSMVCLELHHHLLAS